MDRYGLLCRNIYENRKITQREMAAALELSLGTCNRLIREAGVDAQSGREETEDAIVLTIRIPKQRSGSQGK